MALSNRMRSSLLLVLTAILMLSSCSRSRWTREFELDDKTFDAEAMKMVETDSGLKLPAGAKGLNFHFKPPIDPAFVAKIEIPADSRENLQKQIEAIKNEPINRSGALSTKVTWWSPPAGSILIDRQGKQADWVYLRVVLTHEGGRYFLYVDHSV